MLDFARAGDEAFFSVLAGGDCGAEARKAWDLSSRNEGVDFRLQAGHFLVNSDKKVTAIVWNLTDDARPLILLGKAIYSLTGRTARV
ncbi:MAG TPA: hypothetical protein VFA75_11010 [Nevskia sp.]|nr:hypothetical protein [Nevskia sp.]